jgi:hypothetical protein
LGSGSDYRAYFPNSILPIRGKNQRKVRIAHHPTSAGINRHVVGGESPLQERN